MVIAASREALVAVIEDAVDVYILYAVAARIAALPAASRETLLKMIQAA